MSRPMSATERAYAETREKILEGVHAGGDVITEGQVSSSLGISRTPVREAFLRLQSEGLLELYPKRGAVVVPVSDEEAVSVMEARELIETFAATKVLTENAEPPRALCDAMWHILAKQQTYLRARSYLDYLEADTAFHLVLVEACGNPILGDYMRSLRDRQRRLASRSARGVAERLEASHQEHLALAATFEEGDLDAYLSRLRTHLRHGRARILSAANGITLTTNAAGARR